MYNFSNQSIHFSNYRLCQLLTTIIAVVIKEHSNSSAIWEPLMGLVWLDVSFFSVRYWRSWRRDIDSLVGVYLSVYYMTGTELNIGEP